MITRVLSGIIAQSLRGESKKAFGVGGREDCSTQGREAVAGLGAEMEADRKIGVILNRDYFISRSFEKERLMPLIYKWRFG